MIDAYSHLVTLLATAASMRDHNEPQHACDAMAKLIQIYSDRFICQLTRRELSLLELEHIKQNKRMQAIKSVRQRTGMGLVDCKRLVDKYME